MESGDGDGVTKKGKKIQKRMLNEEADIKPIKKSKGKVIKVVEDQLLQNDYDYFGDDKKEKQVTEDVDKTVKPKKKKNKAEEVHGEDIQNELLKYGLSSDSDDEAEAPVKLDKKVKKNQETEKIIETREAEEEEIASSPKKAKKEKKSKKIANLQQNGEVSEEKHHEVDEVESPKKKMKSVTKIPTNLSKEHELHSDSQAPDEALTKTQESIKKKKNVRSPPKSRQFIGEPSASSSEEEMPAPAESGAAEINAPVEPVKRKRRIGIKTKIPADEQLTLGESYNVKRVKEKNCKNCNEVVKSKHKTPVRDMGTQTLDSALFNVNKKLRDMPRVKDSPVLLAEDRIIRPTQPSENDECTDVNRKTRPKFTKQQMDFLRNLVIEMKSQPLQQHQIGNQAGCRPLDPAEKKHFRQWAKLRMGAWDPSEDQILVKNWLKFCKKHDWDSKYPEPFTSLRHKGAYYMPKVEERIKFVQFLAKNLPNRCLYSVMKRFRRLYSPRRTDRYTATEDEEIMKYMSSQEGIENGRHFAELAEKLNRSRESVYRRFKLLQKQADQE